MKGNYSVDSVFLLQGPHLRVTPIELQQLGMVTPLNDVPGFHDQYFMGIHHSRQAVGDDQKWFLFWAALANSA
jgi:hypothetical protein